MKSLPKFLKRYFWDVSFLEFNKENHASFIIERILEYGDKKAVGWMRSNFDSRRIKNVLQKSRNLSQRSANFWQLIFNLKKDKILCLKKSFRERQRLIWKH